MVWQTGRSMQASRTAACETCVTRTQTACAPFVLVHRRAESHVHILSVHNLRITQSRHSRHNKDVSRRTEFGWA